MGGASEKSAEASPGRLTLAKAMGHPVQGRVLSVLYERPGVTIRQIGGRLEEPSRRIRHQVELLLGAGLVEVIGEEYRRGTVERRYATVGPNEIETYDGVDLDLRVRIASGVIRLLLADIAAAARAGTLGGEDERRCEARFYGEVDDDGFAELSEIHLWAYRQVERALEASRDRVRKSGRPGTEVVSGLFFFEAPLWGSKAGSGSSEKPDG